MDLRLYARVVRRFRLLVAIGFVAAVGLAVLSYAHVSFAGGAPKLTPRADVTYGSDEMLLVTQLGFPEGRSTFPVTDTPNGPVSSFADPSRFSSLAAFYAYLANGDTVTQQAARMVGRRAPGKFIASPVLFTATGNPQVVPILQIRGLGTAPRVAIAYARAGSDAFRTYLDAQQERAGITPSQRVVVKVLNQANKAGVLVPRKKTLPIVVFLTVLAATLALALVLENLRPQIKTVTAAPHQQAPHEQPLVESQRSIG